MENRFNLIDEPWIPVVERGLVSLRDIFQNKAITELKGNAVEKLAMLKLLLAIAQSAKTPKTEKEWKALTANGLADTCLHYLDTWHHRFYLYGKAPFLQMPAIVLAPAQPIDMMTMDIAVGNKTMLRQNQQTRSFTDADKALLVVTQMAFGLGGKKGGQKVVLSRSGLKKKPAAKPAPAMVWEGPLHSFILGKTLQETIWLNLLDEEQIAQIGTFQQGLGVAPWEVMPESEDCEVAKGLQRSLIGRLVPMSRFLLLSSDGVHFSEGIIHPGYAEGAIDPSVTVEKNPKKWRLVWVDPNKRPWRDLTALLGFIDASKSSGFQCWQLTHSLGRARGVVDVFSIWSAGLRVSNPSGVQYISGRNDFIESTHHIESSQLGEVWFAHFTQEMKQLDALSRVVYACVNAFFKAQQVDGKSTAKKASLLFWQLCEQQAQNLIDYCDDPDQCAQLWRLFTQYAHQAYNTYCPNNTARQMEAWAQSRPKTHSFLTKKA